MVDRGRGRRDGHPPRQVHGGGGSGGVEDLAGLVEAVVSQQAGGGGVDGGVHRGGDLALGARAVPEPQLVDGAFGDAALGDADLVDHQIEVPGLAGDGVEVAVDVDAQDAVGVAGQRVVVPVAGDGGGLGGDHVAADRAGVGRQPHLAIPEVDVDVVEIVLEEPVVVGDRIARIEPDPALERERPRQGHIADVDAGAAVQLEHAACIVSGFGLDGVRFFDRIRLDWVRLDWVRLDHRVRIDRVRLDWV